MYQLSFIIPVYNGQDYIIRCLDSITNLAIPEKDYEVIVVDDCSTDNTRDIVREYISSHKQVRLICQPENHRQGAARNRGINEARGEYIMFVDSDDEVSTDLVKTLPFAVTNALDMVFCTTAWQNISGDFVPRQYDIPNQVIMNGEQFADKYYDEFCVGPWTYLWRRDFLLSNNIPFVENRRMEDFDFVEKHIVKAKKIAYSNLVTYRYYINPNSTVRTTSFETVADWVNVCYRRWIFCDTLHNRLPSFIHKIENQCRCFIGSSLSIRRLSRFPVWDVQRILNRIGQNELDYLYSKSSWPVFTKLCMRHRGMVLVCIFFAYPIASIGRFLAHSIRKQYYF